MHVRGVTVGGSNGFVGLLVKTMFFIYHLSSTFHVLCGSANKYVLSFFSFILLYIFIRWHGVHFLSRSLISGFWNGLVLSVTICWLQNIVT